MLPDPASYHDERGNHVEPGLIEMLEYMRTGKFKVFKTCSQFFEEMRMYHRDEKGILVKLKDDIICATRYAFVMRRMARPKPPSVMLQGQRVTPILGQRRWKASR